jgi:hypothetical protein
MKTTMLLFILSIFSLSAYTQTKFMILRGGITDIDLRNSAKTFITQGGNPIEIIAEDFAHNKSIGFDFYGNVGYGNWFVNIGVNYQSANFLGNSTFDYKFTDIDSTTAFANSETAYTQVKLGAGLRLWPNRPYFVSVDGLLDLEFGEFVSHDDAYLEFINNNSMVPESLNAQRTALVGIALRLNVGFGAPDNLYLIFSPSLKYGWRFDDEENSDMIKSSPGRISAAITMGVAKSF